MMAVVYHWATAGEMRTRSEAYIVIGAMPPKTDEEVVQETLANKDAFVLIIERYEAKLLRYLERLGVGVREDREDILQNAFIKAYKNLNGFDPTLAFSSWMYRIAHNEAMSFFRSKHARPQVILSEEGSGLIKELEDEGSDTAALAELRLSRDELAKAFVSITPQYRDALTLRFFENRSYVEMSDILEVPVGTVSTLIHRAKKALRAALPTQFIP
jgi:RNA polymerase sigma-70 factor (ECF subfamily)